MLLLKKTAHEIENYPGQAESHFNEIKNTLVKEGSDFNK